MLENYFTSTSYSSFSNLPFMKLLVLRATCWRHWSLLFIHVTAGATCSIIWRTLFFAMKIFKKIICLNICILWWNKHCIRQIKTCPCEKTMDNVGAKVDATSKHWKVFTVSDTIWGMYAIKTKDEADNVDAKIDTNSNDEKLNV